MDENYGFRIEPYSRSGVSPLAVFLALAGFLIMFSLMSGYGMSGSPSNTSSTTPLSTTQASTPPPMILSGDVGANIVNPNAALISTLQQRVRVADARVSVLDQRARQAEADLQTMQTGLAQAQGQLERIPQLESAVRIAAQRLALEERAVHNTTQQTRNLQLQLTRVTDQFNQAEADNTKLRTRTTDLQHQLDEPKISVSDLIELLVVGLLVSVAIRESAIRRLKSRYAHVLAKLYDERDGAVRNETLSLDRLRRSRLMYHNALKQLKSQLQSAQKIAKVTNPPVQVPASQDLITRQADSEATFKPILEGVPRS